MCSRSGTRGNPPPHRHHQSSHAPSPHSSSIAERNQSRLRLFSEATTKSAATTPAPAAAGKNTRSATEREEHDAEALAPPPLKRPSRILLGGNLLEFPQLRQESQSSVSSSFPPQENLGGSPLLRQGPRGDLASREWGGKTTKPRLSRFEENMDRCASAH